jgi:hypothetical protein
MDKQILEEFLCYRFVLQGPFRRHIAIIDDVEHRNWGQKEEVRNARNYARDKEPCLYCPCKRRPFRTKEDWALRQLHKACYWKLVEP